MALSTYTELKESVADWLDRDDLTTRIPDFITLLESRLNRVLRVPQMEDQTTQVVSSGSVALPTGFLAARAVYIDSNPDEPMVALGPQQLRELYPSETGSAHAYTIVNDQFEFAPSLDGDSVVIEYWKEIPALGDDNSSNWLLAAYPDVYLWGALVMAEVFIDDQDRAATYYKAWEQALAELRNDGVKRAAPATLQTRPGTVF